ncbi:Hypothetical protein GLP15_1724 [Giardia lamblia P15]|uniref:Uncharacterized protein n=1 Tax=Giardia intestinalis (strain P15) TaxID=658858 RepID=E1F7D2_GIAIA|nr:Hypothetical protein GLP15_1724 [Giardia lamblia P15]
MDATPPPFGARKVCHESPLERKLCVLEQENEYLRSELVQTRAELLRVTRRKQALEIAVREQRQRLNKIADGAKTTDGGEDAALEAVKAEAYQKFTHEFIMEAENYKNTMLATQAESYEAMADALIASMHDLFSTKETIYNAELERLRGLNRELEKKCAQLTDKLNRMKVSHKTK